MATSEIYLGDWGTVIEITLTDEDGTVLDCSTATAKAFLVQTPSGRTKTWTAAFKTDGSDGVLTYTTAADDIDENGYHEIQARVTFASGVWHSTKETFLVHATLT